MNAIRVIWAVCALTALATGRSVREAQSKNFMGEGTDSFAVSLLQSESNTKTNLVFSPLGYSTILAILAEGARGNTRNQLVSALKLPEDTYALRSTFKSVLENMQEHMVLNKPEFKNWFYVYKNYTVEDSYKVVLKDNYLTEVKEIENYDLDESATKDHVVAALNESKNPSPAVQQPVPERLDVIKDEVTNVEKPKDSSEEKGDKKKVEDGSSEEKLDRKKIKEKDSSEEKEDKNKSQDKDSSEEKDENKVNEKDSSEEKVVEKEKNSKTKDSNLETKTKVEVPAKDVTEEDENKAVEEVDEDPKPLKHEAENIIHESETKTENEKETVKKTLEKLAMEDIVARSFNGGKQVEKEVLTALSANRLSSFENSTVKGSEKKTVSRMIIFNALYFRGNWSVPFNASKEPLPFYLSDTDKVSVDAMSAKGEFSIGQFPELGASAVELPYQGERYSLLFVLPNERNGLNDVIAKLSNFTITDISNKLTKQISEVCIPKFGFYSITRPKEALVKCGITDIFNESSDLSGITGTKGLFLDDLVQLVTIDVDSSSSSFNWLTTSDVADLGRTEPFKFAADHPFFFVLRDRVENVVVVAGKVMDPRKLETRASHH